MITFILSLLAVWLILVAFVCSVRAYDRTPLSMERLHARLDRAVIREQALTRITEDSEHIVYFGWK